MAKVHEYSNENNKSILFFTRSYINFYSKFQLITKMRYSKTISAYILIVQSLCIISYNEKGIYFQAMRKRKQFIANILCIIH